MSKKAMVWIAVWTMVLGLGMFAQGFDMTKIAVVPDSPQTTMRANISVDRGQNSLYMPGESISISFWVNQDAYVVVYDILPNGRVHIIFPNQYDRNNFVRANQVTRIPRAGYNLVIENIPGREYLQIVASTKQFASFNQWTGQFSATNPFPLVSSDPVQYFQGYAAKIIVVPDQPKPNWTSAHTWFNVAGMPQPQPVPLTGSVYMVSYPHGAMIILNGQSIGIATPAMLTLDEGWHHVRFVFGHRSYETTFYVSPGTTTTVSGTL